MNSKSADWIRNPQGLKINLSEYKIIKTQQGFSQHTFKLSVSDAKIYTDLLDKYSIWWVDVTNYPA